jgi:hypothetical protein
MMADTPIDLALEAFSQMDVPPHISVVSQALDTLGLGNKQVRLAMTLSEIKAVIDQIKPGDVFEVQFKGTRMIELYYLSAFHEAKLIVINPVEHMIMMAVMWSRSWDRDSNRIFEVTAGPEWVAEVFSDQLLDSLESFFLIRAQA